MLMQASNAFDITVGAEGAVFARAVVGPIEVRNWTVTAGATIVAGCFRSRWLLNFTNSLPTGRSRRKNDRQQCRAEWFLQHRAR